MTVVLGDALVRIRPDTSSFGSDLSRGTSRGAAASGRNFGRIFASSSLGPMRALGAAALGLFAADKVKDFFADSIGEAREAQKVGAITAQVIKTTGGAANVSAEQVGRLATAISNKTGIDDEAIQSGANLLLTFKNVRNEVGKGNDVFDQATQTITDMGAALGKEPSAAAVQLGKALNDPVKGITALTKVGVTFTEQQKDQIKTLVESGDTVKAQKIILGELQSEFGGTAAATATMGDKFKVAFGNLKESVGTALLPLIDRFLGGLSGLANKIAPKIQPAFDAVGRLAGPVLTTLGGFTDDVVGVFSDVASRVATAFNGVSLGDVGSQLATQAKAWAGPIIDGFKSGLSTGDWSGLGTSISEGLIKAVGAAGGLAGKIGTVIGGFLSDIDWVGIGISIGKQAPSLLVGLAAGILNFDLGGLLSGLASHWQDILLAILAVAFTPGRIIGKVGEALARIPLAGRLLQWGLVHFKTFSDGLVGLAGRALGFLGRAFVSGFRRVFPSVGKAFAEQLGLLPTRLGVMAIDLAERAVQLVKGLGSGISQGVGSVVAKIGEVIGLILRPFAQAGTWLVRSGFEVMQGMARGVATGVGAVVRVAGSIVGKIVGALSGLGGGLRNVAVRAWRAHMNAAQSGSQLVVGLVKTVPGKVVGALSALAGRLASVATRAFTSFAARERAGISTAVSVVRSLPAKAAGALSALSGKLAQVATAAFTRFVAAEKVGITKILAAARGIPGKVKSAIGNVGSTLFNAGQSIIQGLINGIQSKIGAVTSKLRELTSKIPDWKGPRDRDRNLLRGAGRLIMEGLVKGLDEGSGGVKSFLGSLTEQIGKALNKRYDGKALKAHTRAVLKSLKDEYAGLVANGKAQDTLAGKLANARQKLEDIKSYVDPITSGIASFGSVTGVAAGDGAGGIVSGLQDRLAQVKAYVANVQALTKAGLNKTSLQQIIDTGVDGGFNTAQALASGGKAALTQVNKLAAQIAAQGASLAESTSAKFFGVGVSAQQGIVDGLTRDQKALVAAAETIANTLVQTVKKKLKIKSPSGVFRELGQHTAHGLTRGVREVDVRGAGGRMASDLLAGYGRPAVSGRSAAAQLGARATQSRQASTATDPALLQAIRDLRAGLGGRQAAPLAAGDLVIREYLDLDRLKARQRFLDRATDV